MLFPVLTLIRAGPKANHTSHLMAPFPPLHLWMKSGDNHNMALNKRLLDTALPLTEAPSLVKT